MGLEACLADTGDLALVGQLAEADTADAVVTQVSVGAAADLAAVVLTSGELLLLLLLEDHRCFSHFSFSLLELFQKSDIVFKENDIRFLKQF